MALCPKCNKQELRHDEELCPHCKSKRSNMFVKVGTGALAIAGAVATFFIGRLKK